MEPHRAALVENRPPTLGSCGGHLRPGLFLVTARYTAPGGKRFGKTFLTETDGNAWLHRQYVAISNGSWEKSSALTPILFRDYATNWPTTRRVK